MSRPRKGTPESELATQRWRETMQERYGGVTEKMQEIGSIGGKKGRNCGILSIKGEAMDIKGHDGYRVLSCGVVLSKSGKPMKPQIDNKGYHRVQIRDYSKHNNIRTCKVHRLVAEHFLPNPNNYPQIDHLDGDKTNNDLSNLEWVTNEENMKRAVANGVHLSRKPEAITLHAGKVLGAINDGYVAADVMRTYGIKSSSTFWKWVERDGIKMEEYEADSTWKKKRYYYFDNSRNKWRVERSDFIPVGKQFDTEKEAKEYSEQYSGGGFASNKVGSDGLTGQQRAKRVGAVGGAISRRKPKVATIEQPVETPKVSVWDKLRGAL